MCFVVVVNVAYYIFKNTLPNLHLANTTGYTAAS
jgi:hypothetical protein